MYIYIYIYMYIYINTYICIYIYICIYVYIYVYMYIYIYIVIYISMYLHIYIDVCTHVCIFIHVYCVCWQVYERESSYEYVCVCGRETAPPFCLQLPSSLLPPHPFGSCFSLIELWLVVARPVFLPMFVVVFPVLFLCLFNTRANSQWPKMHVQENLTKDLWIKDNCFLQPPCMDGTSSSKRYKMLRLGHQSCPPARFSMCTCRDIHTHTQTHTNAHSHTHEHMHE